MPPNTTQKDLSLQKEAILKSLKLDNSLNKKKTQQDNRLLTPQQQDSLIGSFYRNNIAPAQLQTMAQREIVKEDVINDENAELENNTPEAIPEINTIPETEQKEISIPVKENAVEIPPAITIPEQQESKTQSEAPVEVTNIPNQSQISNDVSNLQSAGVIPQSQNNNPIENLKNNQTQSISFPQENINIPIEQESNRRANLEENLNRQPSVSEERNIPVINAQQENQEQSRTQGQEVNNITSLINAINNLNSRLDIFIEQSRDNSAKFMELMIGYTKYLENIQTAIENIDLTVDKPNDNLPFS